MLDFPSFLLSCRSYDPGHPEPRALPDWPFVRQLADQLVEQDRLIVLKSRQMLVSWIGCAWLLYRALHHGPGLHLVLSKEERSAKELIDRIRFLHSHLPEQMGAERIRFSRSEVLLPELEARIISLPATPHAVRGLSPRTVLWDEMAFARYDEEIWTAVKPAVDAGGRFVGVSTPNGPSGVFARLAREGGPRFQVERIHYSDNPGRGEGWVDDAKNGLSSARWRREQELSFEVAEGRVYDQFDRSVHVLKRVHRPGRAGRTLYRGIDFGYRRPAAVWAEELADGRLVVFAELLGEKWPLSTFAEQIAAVDDALGLSEADFTHTAVDPAGASVTDSGISSVEQLRASGMKILHRTSHISSGVERVRELLVDARGRVRMQIDPRCRKLVEAFGGYEWEGESDTPRKDGLHDHLMDALRYLVINLPRFRRAAAEPPPRIAGLPPWLPE